MNSNRKIGSAILLVIFLVISSFSPSNAVGETIPTLPLNVQIEENKTTVTVMWTAPLSDGGLPITSYNVATNVGGFSCSTTTELKCVINNLEPTVTYIFMVFANNQVGQSEPGLSVPTKIYPFCTILSVLLKKKRIITSNMEISQLFNQLNSIQSLQARQRKKQANMIVHFGAVNVWQTKANRIIRVVFLRTPKEYLLDLFTDTAFNYQLIVSQCALPLMNQKTPLSQIRFTFQVARKMRRYLRCVYRNYAVECGS